MPDNVFVVSAVDESVDFAASVVTEEDSALDVFSEKEIARFGEQLFFFAFSFDE